MEAPYTPPNILRLRGVTLSEYVPMEVLADQRFAEFADGGGPDDPAPESAQPFDTVPRVFTGLGDWPYSTNLLCWSCGFGFDGRPKFVPTYVREGEGGGVEVGVLGNMCTFNCAELWIQTQLSPKNEDRWRYQDNLRLVYILFTGRRVAGIAPAPSRLKLRQYGGTWDEDKFWRRLRQLDPAGGLRDHTPGSVIPERERPQAVRAVVQAQLAIPPVSRATATNAWGVCGQPRDAASAGGDDAVSVDGAASAVSVGAPPPGGDAVSVGAPPGGDAGDAGDDLAALLGAREGVNPADGTFADEAGADEAGADEAGAGEASAGEAAYDGLLDELGLL